VNPPSLVFSGFTGGANPPAQSVRVSSTPGDKNWAATTSDSWI